MYVYACGSKHIWMDVSVFIGSVYVGICVWVQAYLDGCECVHS